MYETSDILISVEARHARNMLNGSKRVELRKKALNVEAGTRVWVYSKLPTGMVQVVAAVEGVESATPIEIWRKYRRECAISKSEFDDYFADSKSAHAIKLIDVRKVERAPSLEQIREKASGFQPPQFFKWLQNGSPELGILNAALISA